MTSLWRLPGQSWTVLDELLSARRGAARGGAERVLIHARHYLKKSARALTARAFPVFQGEGPPSHGQAGGAECGQRDKGS